VGLACLVADAVCRLCFDHGRAASWCLVKVCRDMPFHPSWLPVLMVHVLAGGNVALSTHL